MRNSNAALYGKGIFTTIAIRDGKPCLWAKHWKRLIANAAKIDIDLSEHSENSTRSELETTLTRSNLSTGRARITFIDESAAPIWSSENTRKTSLLIITDSLRPVAEDFGITVSPYPINSRSPLVGVKSCNYLENLLAYDEAKKRGFAEAIRVSERGHVTSVCMANLFWLQDGVLYTPSLATGCLAGTTREFVLENIDCCEVEAEIISLHEAEAIFLTSAGLGVHRVAAFELRKFEKIDHPILRLEPFFN